MDNQGLTIEQIQNQLVSKKYSAEELFKDTLDTIKEKEHKIGAFITLSEEEIVKKAQGLDRKLQKGTSLGNLEGALYSIKDNIMMKNQRCTCASNMLKNFIAPYDGECTLGLNEAGAVSLGKTNMDEFAMGSSTEHSAFKVTRNPRDYKRVAGGSSGGSAAAVAAGFGHFSLGSDTGGSVRQPAAFCGVLGMKPTYGLVSRLGLVSFAPSMDQIGILANNSRDIARVLEEIQGPDFSKDYTLVRKKPVSYDQELQAFTKDRESRKEKPLKGITIGIPKEFFEISMEKEVEKALDSAMEAFKSQGAKLISLSIPHFGYGLSAYHVLSMVEAVSNLARFDGVGYGNRASNCENIEDVIEKSRGQGFGEEVKRRLILGNYILSKEKQSLVRAKKVQKLLQEDFQQGFQQADFLFTPTTHTTAFKLGKKSKSPLDMQRLDELTVPVSLTGLPAISVPCQEPGNLPVGGQLIGNYFDETVLLKGALGLEQVLSPNQQKGNR
ncbi:Asp-tRNA(Asn)/Glu-tRNA(Gln) amidotransferase subunit GatA [Isachenkonia alkalipeptolytica]|uniref:Asp-tRNA(Asn)/Glu-tRNA(Gln) amidotransferase subunit GatA n=1 Tax=Isachenkonia alkalipeptolytica TaxID=2565777 RepID=UPI00136F535F|nr:Asp-tRNA(Asn)/Glu-tRNA(Gln) amidotransferase subunit GatA [Isachenkonia alkalipeptolytica]